MVVKRDKRDYPGHRIFVVEETLYASDIGTYFDVNVFVVLVGGKVTPCAEKVAGDALEKTCALEEHTRGRQIGKCFQVDRS
jgi:hypothetical protein